MIVKFKRKRKMSEFHKDCLLALVLCTLFVACAAFDEAERGQQTELSK